MQLGMDFAQVEALVAGVDEVAGCMCGVEIEREL